MVGYGQSAPERRDLSRRSLWDSTNLRAGELSEALPPAQPLQRLRRGVSCRGSGLCAADELVTVASMFWDFGSLSLKTLRRPLCQLLWQRQSATAETLPRPWYRLLRQGQSVFILTLPRPSGQLLRAA